MTTNHPANGPVSLERLHQIREILSKAAAQSDGGNLGYAMADAVKVIDGAIAEFGVEPAPVVPDDLLSMAASAIEDLLEHTDPSTNYYSGVWADVPGKLRAAMLQSFGNSEKLDEVGSWNNHMNTPTAKPAIDTGELLKHIEGMEVSVDVSTCDADAGHRYFGTVTEISELDTARNGYILLVQDAKPNFKPADNSPVIPDGWQLVPKEPTEAMNKAGWAAMNEHDAINPTYRAMLAAAPQQENV
ncbi:MULTISPECIES: DUF550 domain-containing protein [Enterobacteriaceae]|uniref:DUF550 domain-containing protein n=1 Tax=Enterobacteriaceae TaxID=543 RepID=UPI001E333302|nr:MULTISPECIES: DUF550 domain-containing protein [Enterobacteriaceae]